MIHPDFQQSFTISSVDADASYHCRPSALLACIQRAVTAQSVVVGTTKTDMLAKYGGFWMVLRLMIRLKRPILWNEQLTVRVIIRRPVAKRIYRDCDLYVGEEQVGDFTSLWVLADEHTHKPMFMEDIPDLPTENPPDAKDLTLSRLVFPQNMTLHDSRRLYYSDIDLNGHMNNTRYVDLAADAAELDLRPRGVFMQELQISYVGECRSGDLLRIYRGKENGGLYIHGVGDDGTPRFDCLIRMSEG